MKRLLLVLAALAALACTAPDPARYGTVRVAVLDCPEPHATWAREAVPALDALGGPAWTVVDSSAHPDVIVRCVELADGAAGEYVLGASEVVLDVTRTPHEFAVRAVVEHELVHWRIARGPRPERALTHVCEYDGELYADGTAVTCAPGILARIAVMSPGLSRGDPFYSSASYDGADLPQPDPTRADEQLFHWAVDP